MLPSFILIQKQPDQKAARKMCDGKDKSKKKKKRCFAMTSQTTLVPNLTSSDRH
jgi:hypothetical protein